MQIDSDLILNILLVATAVIGMKFLPRLMAGVPFVDAAEVKGLLDSGEDLVILDVRTQGEFEGSFGRVTGAVNLPLQDLAERLKRIEGRLASLKDEKIYIHCMTENRASKAARILKKAGFSKISVIKGGIRGCRKAGLTVAPQG